MQYTKLVGSWCKVVGREVVNLSVGGIKWRTAGGSGRKDEAIVVNIHVFDIIVIIHLVARNDFADLLIDGLDYRGEKREWLSGLNATDIGEVSDRTLVNGVSMDVALLFHWNEWVSKQLQNPIQSEENGSGFCIACWLATGSGNDIAVLIINMNRVIVIIMVRQ